jgi:hypothetical protein
VNFPQQGGGLFCGLPPPNPVVTAINCLPSTLKLTG